MSNHDPRAAATAGAIVPAHRPPVFSGWYVAVACSAVAFVAWGVAFFNLGVFLNALHLEHGWSRSALSGSITLYYVVAGGVGVIAGRVVDRRGPRPLLLFGGSAIGLGVLLLGRVDALWQVYALHALIAAGNACTDSLVIGAVIARWFSERRALAMTVALSGASLGGMALVPLNTFLIERAGTGTGALVLALIAWAAVIPVALFVIRYPAPPLPSAITAPAARSVAPPPSPAAATTEPHDQDWRVRETMRSPVWWMPAAAFALMMVGQIGFIVHQVGALRPTLGGGGAATALSVVNAGAFAGRLLLGATGDRLSKHTIAGGCFLLQALTVLTVAHTDNHLLIYLSMALLGMTVSNVVALQPLLMAEVFGVRSYGRLFGPAYLLTRLGAGAGPLLVGVLIDRTGGYAVPFTVTATLALAAAALVLLAPRRAPERTRNRAA